MNFYRYNTTSKLIIEASTDELMATDPKESVLALPNPIPHDIENYKISGTDTLVHKTKSVRDKIKLEKEFDPVNLLGALNANLPPERVDALDAHLRRLEIFMESKDFKGLKEFGGRLVIAGEITQAEFTAIKGIFKQAGKIDLDTY